MTIVTWECNVYDSTKHIYVMILGRDPLTALGLDLKLSEHVIAGGDVIYEVCTAPMVDISTYYYYQSNLKEFFKPEESFMDSYVE